MIGAAMCGRRLWEGGEVKDGGWGVGGALACAQYVTIHAHCRPTNSLLAVAWSYAMSLAKKGGP